MNKNKLYKEPGKTSKEYYKKLLFSFDQCKTPDDIKKQIMVNLIIFGIYLVIALTIFLSGKWTMKVAELFFNGQEFFLYFIGVIIVYLSVDSKFYFKTGIV